MKFYLGFVLFVIAIYAFMKIVDDYFNIKWNTKKNIKYFIFFQFLFIILLFLAVVFGIVEAINLLDDCIN